MTAGLPPDLDMTAPEISVAVHLSDDDAIPFFITESDGITPVPIAGANLQFHVLPSQRHPASSALFIRSTPEGITIDGDGLAGTGKVILTASNKATMESGREYYYRLRWTDQAVTVMRGPLRTD